MGKVSNEFHYFIEQFPKIYPKFRSVSMQNINFERISRLSRIF